MPSTMLLYYKDELSALNPISLMRLKNLKSGSISIDDDNPLYLAAYSIEDMGKSLSKSKLKTVVIGSKSTYLVNIGRWDEPGTRKKGPIIGRSLPGSSLGNFIQKKFFGCFVLYFGSDKLASLKDTNIFRGRGSENRAFSDLAILAALREHAKSTTSGGLGDAVLDVVGMVTDAVT